MVGPFWISLLLLLLLVVRTERRQNPEADSLAQSNRPATGRAAAATGGMAVETFAKYAFAVTTGFLLLSSVLSTKHAKAFSLRLSIGRQHLAELIANPSGPADLPALALLYKTDVILARYSVVAEHHLSLCKQRPMSPPR
jgi:hypothetical protein